MRRVQIILAALLLAAAPALPAAAENSWGHGPYGVYDTDDMKKDESGRRIPTDPAKARYTGVLAFTTDAARPGVLLTCSDKAGLTVTFALNGADFTDDPLLTRVESALRAHYGEVVIGTAKPIKRQKFLYRRKLAIAHGLGKEIAYRTVEAIYARDPITITIPHVDPVTFALPAPDAALTEFISGCPAFE